MRDHGGNMDWAIAQYGGDTAGWIDLSTGINPRPYPLPPIAPNSWAALPTHADMAALRRVARTAYDTQAQIVPLAGAQAAIQLVPHLRSKGRARVLTPTYNEHAGALAQAGWTVEEANTLADLRGADLAVVVNPNNPDGSRHSPKDLTALRTEVGLLVVDESFADPAPELSIAPTLDDQCDDVIVLRSFGKFYGLAGVRLGFALTGTKRAEQMRAMAGPWPVCGPAIAVGVQALGDQAWHRDSCARLARDSARLDALAERAGWHMVGGTPLFRSYATPDAARAQNDLAHAHIWSRIFPYSDSWIRLGLPDGAAQWARVAHALAGHA